MKKKWLATTFILAVVSVCAVFIAGSLLMDFTPFFENKNQFHAEVLEGADSEGMFAGLNGGYELPTYNAPAAENLLESPPPVIVKSESTPTPVHTSTQSAKPTKTESPAAEEYRVYSYNTLIGKFDSLESAIEEAKKHTRACVKIDGKDKMLWDNYEPFIVYLGDGVKLFEYNFGEAVKKAKEVKDSVICLRSTQSIIWENKENNVKSHIIKDVPLIGQLPELYRGCEVTSLAMLMNFFGKDVSKMTLADEIAKDETPKTTVNGKTYWGNPNIGFVGDIADVSMDGLGVYHTPIYELLREYFPETAVDLTGCEFSELYKFINQGSPVWIITNSKYKELDSSQFLTWSTSSGDIKVTYSEHSVLITGYDEKYIYFNDPYLSVSRYNKADFIAAWEQMGKQAVTILNYN